MCVLVSCLDRIQVGYCTSLSVVCVVCSVGPPLLVLSLVGDFPEPALECRCGAPRAGYHDRSRDVVLAPVTVLDYHGASVSVTSG